MPALPPSPSLSQAARREQLTKELATAAAVKPISGKDKENTTANRGSDPRQYPPFISIHIYMYV